MANEWRLDGERRLLSWRECHYRLTRRELSIVETLAIQRGSVVRHDVLHRVLYPDLDAAEDEHKALLVHVCRVRQGMRAAGMPRAIATVWGKGFVWQPPITVLCGGLTVLSAAAGDLLWQVLAQCPDRDLVDRFCWAAGLPLPPE
jgi:DNA-binding winged helix-turn-helix (wHTH) protein